MIKGGSASISDKMTERVEDPSEKALLGKYHLAYQHGKGSRRMVPILIPVDMLTALKLLVEVQPECAVDSANPYLFPTTKSSDGHAGEWQRVSATCMRAGVSQPDKLTATKMRHGTSTFYGLLDLPENERSLLQPHSVQQSHQLDSLPVPTIGFGSYHSRLIPGGP